MQVTVIQTSSADDKAANLAQAETLLRQAIAVTRPDLVVLPELFAYLGGTAGYWLWASQGKQRRLRKRQEMRGQSNREKPTSARA